MQWTPEQIGTLTLSQILCLANEHPPGKGKLTTAESFADVMARRKAEEDAWEWM